MKWPAWFLVAFAGLIVAFSSPIFAASSAAVSIESISHNVGLEGKEKLTFKLSAQVVPNIFTIKGDNPRLVIDFPDTIYAGKGVISLAESKLATAIRTAIHQSPEKKTRVVVDLTKQIPVRYTNKYSEAEGTFTVDLYSDSQGGPQKETPPVSPATQKVTIPQTKTTEEVAIKPVNETPAPSVVSLPGPAKKPAVSSATENATLLPVTPASGAANTQKSQLLNVSFDDSSSKGEMVTFHVTGFQPPTISAVEKNNPRVICDFIGMELGKAVEENIFPKGKYVERITLTKHSKPDKVRATLNLTPNRDYDLQQIFFKKDNLFVLIVNELPPEKTTNKVQ
jgi:hypothetical protein